MPVKQNFLDELRRRLPNAPAILEVGAHIGDAVSQYDELWPRANIIAVEPGYENYCALSKRHGERHLCLHCAVGCSSENRVVYVSKEASRNNSIERQAMKYQKTAGHIKSYDKETVRTMTMWEILSTTGMRDFVRFDCYGGEYEIFSDGATWVHKIPFVMVSMHVKPKPFDSAEYKEKRNRIQKIVAGTHALLVQSGGGNKHLIQLWGPK